MDVKLLWLTVVLLSSPLLTLCDPLFVLSAPNLLRVGSSENVFVEAQDYSGGNLNVRISVKNFLKKKEILFKTVILSADNNYQILTDINIPDDQKFFSNDPLEKQYVYLQAQFPSHTLEKVVMVSFQSGYIFVQIDKPIYTPASTVFYRIFSLTTNLKPHSHSAITVEIMNPQGITVSSETIYPAKGMQFGRYSISEVSSLGVWKVVTRYTNTPQKTFTADFEVKEYVPPTFEVILKPSKSFYFVDDQSLTVDIEAKYLFKQKVEGRAFVVFGVMDGEKKTSIPTSLQHVQIMKGEGTAELTREMITKTFRDINQLVGQSIYVSVSLLTESGSEMVEAERRGIQIVTSPYNIHLKKTPQFFKPGMPFSVSVYVTNPDQTPAENVEVEVNPGIVKGHTTANGVAKVTIITQGGSSRLEITAKTKDPQLSDGQQAVKTMTALAYVPKGDSKNYLHISIDAAELKIGDQMIVFLNTGQSPGVKVQDYTYMILSKGQIVHANRFKIRGQPLVTLSLPVTKDMVPSFRFVAYYHVGSSEVVSDSVWVDVKDTCMGTLKLQVKNKMSTYSKGDEVKLQITGDPGARVGLVVVNKAMHVLNKNKLTQTKIWDVIEKHDTGCTAGGGRDSMGVFSDAGLMFESHTAGGTNTRTSDDDDDYYTDSDDIVSRTHFPESWLWEEIDLCENCPAPGADKVVFLRDSITTWQILAVSLSPTLGMCVAEPEEIVIFKQLFIDLKMPYSAVRGEQLEIKAIIHNYTRRRQKVRVEFMETEDVCSLASRKGKYRVIVNVDKDSSIAVSYAIIPMTLGNYMIEVKASAYDSVHTDGVRKTLKVVPEGVLIPMHGQNVELNPVKNGEKPIVVKAELPTDRIPDTPAITYITITDEEISQNVEQAISGDFMGRFIVQPSGNGEENMIYMTLPVIATHYLDSTNQWEAAGMDRRKEAINHINTGYHQQLSFRKSDGSYASEVNRPSSTWLTAYVAKVFTMANNFVAIEHNVICSAIKWLVLNKKPQDGSFKEDSAVTHGEMVGDVRGKDTDASMTAFVVIAMQEGREICAGSVGSLDESIRKAVAFLGGRLPQLTNPYAVALTSYAMANADKLNKDILMKHSSQGEAGRSWTVTGQRFHSLEATAYAVLALVKAKDFDKAGEAVHWLARQQSHYDGSGTTQATIMVFQAVAEYHTQVKDKQNFILEVELSVAGTRLFRRSITRENMHIARSEKVEINRDFTVTAIGNGTAILSVLTLYYARPVEKKSDCTFFDLTVKTEQDSEVKQEGAIESYNLTMDFIYKSNKTDATMTILDIGIPTGFNVENEDLRKLSTGKERFIQKFAMDKVLSERGSLIIYLDKVLRIEPRKISFRMHKMLDVGVFQPAAVTIYEYYSPDARCTKFYHPERTDGALKRLCMGDLCYCAEVIEIQSHSYDAYNNVSLTVYKVTVLDVDLLLDSAIYDMKVLQVLKESTDDKKVEGKVRPFLAPTSWRDHLELKQGESYLIKGKSTDLSRQGGSLKYILREQTCIKYCPTREESRIPEYRKQYISISAILNRPFKEISQPPTSRVREEERLIKACEYGIDYVYKVTVMQMDLAQDSDIYHLKVDRVLKEGTDADAEEKVRPFLAHPRCREHMGLKQGKSYLIMGTVLLNLASVQYMFGEQTWIEYWPTREEGQTRKYKDQYIGISELQNILLREGCAV
ncbi:Complement C3 [Anabarilius grahami]|uniref:Complement C3 n=1 Tax=Anabarilius grahami TaxID=495550 RepID=A0A3N0YK84_ANAGA|nr:Complement C3 [Anabarilius grahami]